MGRGSSEYASQNLNISSNSWAYAACFMVRLLSKRPAACAAENSLAFPLVAVGSVRPWKLSVMPRTCRASS